MRFMFKTDYEDDIRLFPHSGYVWSYGTLLVLLAIAPFVLSSYIVSQLVFVCIYATVGVGLLILTGFTGQASLGHAAFLAIGAYTTAYLQQFGVPFLVYFLAAGILTGLIGAMVGYVAYIWLLHHVSPTAASTYAFVNPVVAVALGALILGEPITLLTLIAAILIVGAVALLLVGQARKAAAPAVGVEMPVSEVA